MLNLDRLNDQSFHRISSARVALVSLGLLFLTCGTSALAQSGYINTFAGGITPGVGQSWVAGPDGGLALNTELAVPNAIASDSSGNIYYSDAFYGSSSNEGTVIRRIDAVTNIVTTIAGNGIAGYSGDGGPATQAELGQWGPEYLAIDASGNIYIEDFRNNAIRKVATNGVITSLPFNPSGYSISGVAVDSAGNVYTVTTSQVQGGQVINDRVLKMNASTGEVTIVAGSNAINNSGANSGDGGLATNALISSVGRIAVDPSGNIFIDAAGDKVRRIDAATGIITTYAGSGVQGISGDGGPATSAQLGQIQYLTTDSAGNLYISDGNSEVQRVDVSTNIITAVAGNAQAAEPFGYSGDGGPAVNAILNQPAGISFDPSGNLYIVDFGNHRIRKVNH